MSERVLLERLVQRLESHGESCCRLDARDRNAIKDAKAWLEPPKFCPVCPHALWAHNPDGSCPCGVDCANVVQAVREGIEGACPTIPA